jgi:hypothetical protein
MAMIRVPIDADWVRRMAELAAVPWNEEAFAAAFERFGWSGPGHPGEFGPNGWETLPGAPLTFPWFDQVDLLEANLRAGEGQKAPYSGFEMYFSDRTASLDDPLDAGMALFCGSFWPPQSLGDLDPEPDPGFFENVDEWVSWVALPEAPRTEFIAEYNRIKDLVQEVCGEPDKTLGDPGSMADFWGRGDSALGLIMESNPINYHSDDWITLRVVPELAPAQAQDRGLRTIPNENPR